jgi:ATP-binding cassette, subfamily B, bacterial
LSTEPEKASPVEGRDEKGGSTWAQLASILSYVRPYAGSAGLVVLLLLVSVGFNTLLSLSLKFFIDYAIVPRDRTMLLAIVAVLIASFFIIVVSQAGRDYLYSRLGAHVLNDLRTDMLRHLQSLSPGFFAQAKPGDLLARFSTDLGAVENAVVLGLPQTLSAFLNVAFSMVFLFFLDWRLALVAVAGLPLCLIGPRVFGPRALEAGYRFRVEQAALAGAIQENLNTQPVVKAFNLTASMSEALVSRGRRVAELAARFNFLSLLTERSPNVAMLAFGIVVVVVSGIMAFNGALSLGSLVSFNALFATVSLHVESVSAVTSTLLQAAGGMRRIREILDEAPAVVELPDAAPLSSVAGGVSLERMSFSYLPGRPVLNDVSLDIPHGFKVAFVGPSGSGKSTIIKVIMRFYDPQSGRVLIDGTNLRDVRLDTVYDQFGIVFQDSFLFNTSIRDNIRMGKPDASDDEIERAARSAELDPSMFGSAGLDTDVGDRGERLSGGQRQRVAIARALIRDPAVLLLDEATSALDPASAAAVNDTLARVATERTVISVTHRLQDVAGYDRLFVLESGRLKEAGTHAELLQNKGLYATHWRRQNSVSFSPSAGVGRITDAALSEIPLFDSIDSSTLAAISASLVTEHVPADCVVISQGVLGSKFCIIVRGKVAVNATNASGESRQVAVLVDGDHFGEMSLISAAPTTATVKTLLPTILLTLHREQFDRLIRDNPRLRTRLDQIVKERLAGLQETSAAPL